VIPNNIYFVFKAFSTASGAVPDLTVSNHAELDLSGFRNSNLAEAQSGFGENLSWDHRTILLMKLMAPTMLSAVIKRQYSSVLPLLCVMAMTLIKIVNRPTPLDRSATLVLSIINSTYCSCIGIRQIQLEIWPEPDLAGFLKNGRISDLPELQLKSGASLIAS